MYWLTKKVYRAFPKVYLTPLLLAPVSLIALVIGFNIPFEAYHQGAGWISQMIGPATVALAIPLYKNFHVLKKHAVTIGVSVGSGAIVAILTSAWMAKWLQLNTAITDSLAPRSATTAIAMAVSGTIGGIPSITAVFVLLTGLLGMIVGPVVVRLFNIHNDIARGVLLGTSSHNAGTSKAFEFGSLTGSIASVAMVLTAFITMCAAPLLIRFIS
ncbi:LrgB family protein [Paenibacillus filicis]|uniref:LrgB family protein n=2 Tax=Paenibacillus gyeongsangnamensis TaxID=3388067 RepID=A0ABT4Q2J8_9BACL|nr:LrgB family protein [Paenibacillus filicis]MCZ8511026.1 LrgB family protein [Paenibacillus filicis]